MGPPRQTRPYLVERQKPKQNNKTNIQKKKVQRSNINDILSQKMLDKAS